MAFAFSANLQEKLDVNAADRVTLVHLYYDDDSAYLAIATTPVVIGDVQYLGCLKNYTNLGETWQLGVDNMVTSATPTIEIAEYTDPVGYSIIKEMNSKSFFGNRVKILEGFDGLALADYATVFDGKVDDFKAREAGITISCISEEWPEFNVSGGVIDAKNTRIEGRALSFVGRTLNPKTDGKTLPVHFGKHWCAAGLCYEITDAGAIRFLFNDPYYDIGGAAFRHATSQDGIRSLTRYNVNRALERALVPSDELLVPVFPIAFTGANAVFTTGHDTGIDYSSVYADYMEFAEPADVPQQVMEDGSVLAECPIRPRPTSGAAHVLTGTGAARTGSMTNVLDGQGDTYMDVEGTTGEILCSLTTRVNLWEQLAHDDIGIPHRGRLITVPSGDVEADSAAFWQTLILGRCKHLTAPAGTVYIYYELHPRLISLSIAKSRAGKIGTGAQDYNYISLLYEQDIDGTWNEIDLTSDAIGPNWNSGIGDGGNYTSDSTELGYLGRKFFDRYLLEDAAINLKCVISGTGAISGRFYDVSLHCMEPVQLDTEGYVLTDYTGFVCPVVETNLLSRNTGWTGSHMLENPIQYIEAMLKVRGRFTNFNTTEWTNASDWFDDFYESWRKESGPQILEKTTFADFIKEYLKYEQFTVFRDSSGSWRLKKMYRTLTDIAAAETLHTLDYNDSDSLEMDLTSSEFLCMEIKSMKSDYIPVLDDYAVKRRWQMFPGDGFSYAYWEKDNAAYGLNRFALDEVALKYTSSPVCDRVKLSGVSYGCVKTHIDTSPDSETTLATQQHWMLLTEDLGAGTTWSDATVYRGEDCENRAVAETYLNQWCNRHRVVRFSSSNAKYKKHEIGDYVVFANVPDTLLGNLVIGFGGEEDEDTVAVNGQDTYKVFVVTDVRKSMNSTTLTCMQCHNLSQFRVLEYGNIGDGFAHA